MSKETDTPDLQVEQLKLARETTRFLLRDCPDEITHEIDVCFSRAIETLCEPPATSTDTDLPHR